MPSLLLETPKACGQASWSSVRRPGGLARRAGASVQLEAAFSDRRCGLQLTAGNGVSLPLSAREAHVIHRLIVPSLVLPCPFANRLTNNMMNVLEPWT